MLWALGLCGGLRALWDQGLGLRAYFLLNSFRASGLGFRVLGLRRWSESPNLRALGLSGSRV